MTTTPSEGSPATAPPASGERDDASRTQIRGSSLLLAGRLLSMGINFGVQVLIVRYLSQSSFGAFAYALSIVALGETIVTLGLDRAVTRFVPIYDERREHGKLLGTLVLVVGSIVSLGLALILLAFGLQGFIADRLISDQQAVSLLLILIILAPIQAMDTVSIGMFAVFANPRAIFFRRYVLAPGFRLVVVLLLVLRGSGVHFLAGGYVVAGAAGLVIYGVVLVRALRRQGLLQRANWRVMEVPYKEIYAFTLPLLTSDLVYTVMNVSDAMMLGYFRDAADVGALRAVQPAAKLNQIVMGSFALLFMPLAARLFARDDKKGINDLYWQTAMWLAVLSFPVFALTFSMSQPLTVTLFGERYAGSAVYMSLLALGYYFNVALGFNGLTLKAMGKVRYIVALNVTAAVTNIVANFLLIPRYGALGAAIGTCAALVAHNVLKQAGLRLGTGITLLQRQCLRVYVAVVGATAALVALQTLLAPPFIVGFVLAGVASVFVLVISRPLLQIGRWFPELARNRLLRLLIGGS